MVRRENQQNTNQSIFGFSEKIKPIFNVIKTRKKNNEVKQKVNLTAAQKLQINIRENEEDDENEEVMAMMIPKNEEGLIASFSPDMLLQQ